MMGIAFLSIVALIVIVAVVGPDTNSSPNQPGEGEESWRRFPEGSEERRQAGALWMAGNLIKGDARAYPSSEQSVRNVIESPEYARFRTVLLTLLGEVQKTRAKHISEYEQCRKAGEADRSLYHAEGLFKSGLILTDLAGFFAQLPRYSETDVRRELGSERKEFELTLQYVTRRLDALQREPPATRARFGIDLPELVAVRAKAAGLTEAASAELASGDPVLAYVAQLDANRLVYELQVALREYSIRVYSKTAPQGI